MIVLGRRFVARTEAIILQAESPTLNILGVNLASEYFFCFFCAMASESLASSRAFLSCSTRDSADSELWRGGIAISEMPRAPLGEQWVQRFLLRHPQLKSVVGAGIESSRLKSSSKQVFNR